MSKVHILGPDRGFVLKDPHLDDSIDEDVAPLLKEIEATIREKLPAAKFLMTVALPNGRSHYLAGDADGPLRRDRGLAMAERLRSYLTRGR